MEVLLSTSQPCIVAPSGCAHHGPVYVVHREAEAPLHPPPIIPCEAPYATRSVAPRAPPATPPSSAPHPNGRYDGQGRRLHALHETCVRLARPRLVRPRLARADLQVKRLRAVCDGPILAHVVYVRDSVWHLLDTERDRAIDATCHRVHARVGSADGAKNADSPSGGVYVATGSSTRVSPGPTRACPSGPQYLPRIHRWVPFRHANSLDSDVTAVVEACAPIMGAAARVLERCVPEVLEGMWGPVRACPAIGELLLLPPPWMQDGRCSTEDGRVGGVAAASIPTQHIASRVSGIPDEPPPDRVRLACEGLSNHHTDPVDSRRLHGVPIIYTPRISAHAYTHLRRVGRLAHPLPSSDLVLAENTCAGEGGRIWRIVTCVPGFVCIVCAHYERMMHANVYPDRSGDLWDGDCLRLERCLVPGVEVHRLVLYSLKTLDSFVKEFQDAIDECESVHEKTLLLQQLLSRLEPPLHGRLLRMYPHLSACDVYTQ